jgi:hypothetical protein
LLHLKQSFAGAKKAVHIMLPLKNSKGLESIIPMDTSEFAVVVAVNNDIVLRDSLMRSPDIQSVREVLVRRGCSSAGQAYNSGMKASASDMIVFAHQDVYFPQGWFGSVARSIAAISARDPDWGVLGVFGIRLSGAEAGHLYSTGLRRVLGCPFVGPLEVGSLDEVVLVVRRSSGLQFDEKLPGFHLYGADICLEARRKGLKCYVISAFCVHNSNGLDQLPPAYSRAYFFLRDKWRNQLPIRTPCMVITRWGLPLFRHNLESWLARNRKSGARCADPATLCQQLLNENRIGSAAAAAWECVR